MSEPQKVPSRPVRLQSARVDFASAAMIRVLAQGMRECGLDPGPLAPASGEARVDLTLKQALVGSAVAQRGLGCLPLLGRGLHRLRHEPTHHALASARDARDLFERWQRLERYIHSRHRCVIESCTATQARIRHCSLGDGMAPSAAEDLVVLGVLAALLEAIGLRRVCVWVADAPAWPEPEVSGIEVAAAQGRTANWLFSWDGPTQNGRRSPMAGLPPELGADPAWPAAAREAYGRLVLDLTMPPTLRHLASEMGLPWRTLQRRLAEASLTYSQLLAQARCRAGAWRLLNTAESIAEVGFVCGFADQPHFTRELQRRVGMPPAAYRAAFASGSPGQAQAPQVRRTVSEGSMQ